MSALTSELADILDKARRERTAIGPLTADHPELTVAQGYDVQDELTRRRVATGDRVIGAKLGLTSKAKQVQMSVAEPGYGKLFASCVHPADEPIVLDELIHPRVEPEIVFLIGEELRGPGVTAGDVVLATRAVCCGFEVIDSRYDNFRFTAADVMADNTSEARIVLGSTYVVPEALDLSLLGLVLEVNGEVETTATGAASLGHPADAVAMLANWLGRRGEAIEPGWVVFSGGLTNAVALAPGTHVRATCAHLGSVGVRAV